VASCSSPLRHAVEPDRLGKPSASHFNSTTLPVKDGGQACGFGSVGNLRPDPEQFRGRKRGGTAKLVDRLAKGRQTCTVLLHEQRVRNARLFAPGFPELVASPGDCRNDLVGCVAIE